MPAAPAIRYGITNGLMHKYERGLNRVSVRRLYEIATKLDVPVVYFYDGLIAKPSHAIASYSSLLLETTWNFAAIKNRRHREAFCDLVRALAQDCSSDEPGKDQPQVDGKRNGAAPN